MYDRGEIEKILPHRGPMLLVNEIQILSQNKLAGKYDFSGEEWFFKGHYPNNPIVPGVILCEVIAQASCGLLGDECSGKIPYLVSIEGAKFRRPVRPGDSGRVFVEGKSRKGPFHFVNGGLYVDDILCAECSLSFVLADERNRWGR